MRLSPQVRAILEATNACAEAWSWAYGKTAKAAYELAYPTWLLAALEKLEFPVPPPPVYYWGSKHAGLTELQNGALIRKTWTWEMVKPRLKAFTRER